jgi:hypothetical protein
MMNTFRWLAGPIAIVGAWWVAIVCGMVAFSIALQLCPAEHLVSDGVCTAPWFFGLTAAIRLGTVGLAAALVVLAAALVAPSHKLQVAMAAYMGGAIVAFNFALPDGQWDAFSTALIVGSVVLLALGKWRANGRLTTRSSGPVGIVATPRSQ